ncbi:MAG: hypothetical protein ACHQK8_05275 [Bacteroidia bacterium]
MSKFVLYNWLIISVTALLVGVYVTVFENFTEGKAYMFFVVAIIFGALFFYRLRKQK